MVMISLLCTCFSHLTFYETYLEFPVEEFVPFPSAVLSPPLWAENELEFLPLFQSDSTKLGLLSLKSKWLKCFRKMMKFIWNLLTQDYNYCDDFAMVVPYLKECWSLMMRFAEVVRQYDQIWRRKLNYSIKVQIFKLSISRKHIIKKTLKF